MPSFLTTLLAPPLCLACDCFSTVLSDDLCRSCQGAVRALPRGHCEKCAEPFGGENISSHVCGSCIKNTPPYRKVWASLLYQGPVVDLIHGVKFGKNPLGLKRLVPRALAAFSQALEKFQPEEILPVPLSFWRRFSRGFNQSFLLAHFLSKGVQTPLPLRRWARRKHQRALARQSKRERLNNLKSAFEVPRAEKVLGKRILIVDDVMTTGATVEALTRCLLRAGAKEIGVYVLSRTPKN